MKLLPLIGRSSELFSSDILNESASIIDIIAGSSFLVIGGAGSIGQAVTKEYFQRNPQSCM